MVSTHRHLLCFYDFIYLMRSFPILRPINGGIYVIDPGSVLFHGTCKCQLSKTHRIIKLFICHFEDSDLKIKKYGTKT
jgi:hypothetical protein